MVEIELKRRRMRTTRRRREVALALVAVLSVSTTVLVVTRSFSEHEPATRPPGSAGGVGVPDAPVDADGRPVTTLAGGPTDTAGAAGATGEADPPASLLDLVTGGGRAPQDPEQAAQPGPTVTDPGRTDDTPPVPTPEDDGPLTGAVDPLLRGLGDTAPVVAPLRRIARGVTTCVDETVQGLSSHVTADCLLPLLGGRE